MKVGAQRFVFYIDQIEALLIKAGKQRNPALFLYRQKMRNPLFMLEGLAKLYAGLHNAKRFTKMKEHCKLVEDALGAIDYYDQMAQQLATNKKVPAAALRYLQAQTREKIQHLNTLLVEKKWLGEQATRIQKFKAKLADADWLNEEAELAAIKDFYGNAIYTIQEFLEQHAYHFDAMETDVHELRRKLRWLSIYPQALRGAIQLQAGKVERPLKKYQTNAIVHSPFNQMPETNGIEYTLLLRKPQFLALSWMIDKLGSLKDSGLLIECLEEALQATEPNLKDAALEKKLKSILGKNQPGLDQLLDEAGAVMQQFTEDQVLPYLVHEVAALNAK